jgi:hypothetical protein
MLGRARPKLLFAIGGGGSLQSRALAQRQGVARKHATLCVLRKRNRANRRVRARFESVVARRDVHGMRAAIAFEHERNARLA